MILSCKDYRMLRAKKPSIVQLFRNSPLYGLDLDLEREQTDVREIDL